MKDLNQVQNIVTELKANITKNVNCIDNTTAIYKMVRSKTRVFNLNYSKDAQDDISEILIKEIYQKLKDDVLASIVESSINIQIN